jgi:hypothetical protein
MRGNIPWDEDPEVNENVVVCSFMPNTSSWATLRPCTTGYRLHCSDARFQLYNKNIGDTFVFIKRPPSVSGFELTTSIALQKITATVQRVTMSFMLSARFFIDIYLIQNSNSVEFWVRQSLQSNCMLCPTVIALHINCLIYGSNSTFVSNAIKTVLSQRKLAFQQKSTFDVSNASQFLIILMIFKMSTGTHTRTLGLRVHFIDIPAQK